MENEIAAEWVDITKLKPWKDNPRFNNAAIPEVAQSIKRFGFAAPIVARKADGMIIAGHTRFAAAKDVLNLEKVPVRWMDLDPADAKLLSLADNKLSELAAWDFNKLDSIIGDMSKDGLKLEGLGFTESELIQFLDESVSSQDVDSDTDFDWQKEWEDMPEFHQENKLAYRTIKIHFVDDNGVMEFGKLIDRKIPPKKNYLWFPEQETRTKLDRRFVDEEN